MKAVYNQPILEIVCIQDEIVRTSIAGWQEGDNDITWGKTWIGNDDE